MKPSPSKGSKASGGKKRSRSESEGSAQESSPPTSPPHPNPAKEWKKSKLKTEDLLPLVNSGFLREKVKDRLGDQRGGSEWEPIKILLEGD
jgi:hypothetical protein